MKIFGRIFFIFSIAVASVITWLNLSWKSIEQLTNTPSETRIDYYLNDFTLMRTDKAGNIRYHMTGKHLIHNQANGASEIYKPLINAKSDDGEHVVINADKATQQAQNANMLLSGDVKAHKPLFNESPEYTLITQNMIYNPSTQTISSADDINFISAQGNLNGTGFETSLDEKELRIYSNVQTEFNPAQ